MDSSRLGPLRLDSQLEAGNKAEAQMSNSMNNAASSSRISASLGKDEHGILPQTSLNELIPRFGDYIWFRPEGHSDPILMIVRNAERSMRDEQLITKRETLPPFYNLEYLSGEPYGGSVLPEDVQISFFSADLSRYPETFRSIPDLILRKNLVVNSLHYWFYDFALGICKGLGSDRWTKDSDSAERDEITGLLRNIFDTSLNVLIRDLKDEHELRMSANPPVRFYPLKFEAGIVEEQRVNLFFTWKNAYFGNFGFVAGNPKSFPYFHRFSLCKSFQKFQRILISQVSPMTANPRNFPLARLMESFMAPRRESRITFKVKWQLLEFWKHEFESSEMYDLGSIVVLVGCLNYADAITCREYMITQWGPGSELILDVLNTAVLNSDDANYIVESGCMILELKPAENESKVIFYGTDTEASAIGEQLLWLASVFRLPENGKISQSTTYCTWRLNDTENFIAIGLNNLCEPIEYPQGENEKSCWASLWNTGVIAYGYSIQGQRTHGNSMQLLRGLEIDATTMFYLAGILKPVEFLDGIIFRSSNAMLYPVSKAHNWIQWHLVTVSSDLECVEILKNTGWYETVNLEEFLATKAILGCWKRALVYLAASPNYQSEDFGSNLSKEKDRGALMSEKTFAGQISLKPAGIGLSLSAGGKFIRLSALRVQIKNGDLGHTDILKRARTKPLLVYDVETQQIWLVPVLCMALHLVQAHLSRSGVGSDIPMAEPRADGGEAAYDTIIQLHDTKFPSDLMHETDPETLLEHVIKFLEVLGSVTHAVDMERNAANVSSSWPKYRARGFDYEDILKREHYFGGRNLPKGKGTPDWRHIAQNPGTIIIVGKGFGQLIRPDPAGPDICNHWTKIPPGGQFLTASMPCIQELIRLNKVDNEEEKGTKLGPDLYWHRPQNSNLINFCSHLHQKRCMLVQELVSGVGISGFMKKGSILTSEELENIKNGAVVFGFKSAQSLDGPCHSVRPERAIERRILTLKAENMGEQKSKHGLGCLCKVNSEGHIHSVNIIDAVSGNN